MRNSSKNARRSSGLTKALLLLATVAVGGVGTVGTLWAMGEIELPWFRRGPQIPPGAIAVPISGVHIPAYTKLTREHITDQATRQIAYRYPMPDQITPDVITDFNKIFGRVLDHDKPAGYVFTESDFFPKGTRPGLVAGIPAGKRSLTLEANKLAGVFGLKVGDHIDLVATVPIDSKNGTRVPGLSGSLAAQQQLAAIQKRASVRVLAQDAVIVSPVTSRNKATSSSSLTSGTQVRSVPIQEIVIAVAPAEVAPISEAIATQVEITCVARSGLPDDPGPISKTPGADPLSEVRTIESISGKKRECLMFSPDGRRVPPEQPETTDTAAVDKPLVSGPAHSGRVK